MYTTISQFVCLTPLFKQSRRMVVWALCTSLASNAAAGGVLYVDDDGPNDPAPHDSSVSDPLEDGSALHPFDAIQEGIVAASPGDEVVILPGVYAGSGNRDVDFLGKEIVVRGQDPNDPAVTEATVVDCQGARENRHRGFIFHSGEKRAAILAGVTITNGVAPLEYYDDHDVSAGGAILCDGASPSIVGCVIRDNIAASSDSLDEPSYGGGICCFGGETLITGCIISKNTTCLEIYSFVDGCGGGVFSDTNLTVEECLFCDNAAAPDWVCTSRGYGGGICCEGLSYIRNCTFIGNVAGNHGNGAGYGGGVDCSDYAEITDCDFFSNYVPSGNSTLGGGAGVASIGEAIVRNCWFEKNETGDVGGAAHGFGDLSLINSTFLNNHADGSEIPDYGGGAVYGAANVQNCLFQDNSSKNGGALFRCGSIADSCIIGNSAWNQGGGLMRCYGPVSGCVINDNHADWWGGGAYDSDGDFVYCDISGNSSRMGAGVCSGEGALINCRLTANAGLNGGGILIWDGNVINCTIADNTASQLGGGAFQCKGVMENCIIWGNYAPDDPQLGYSSIPQYSCIQDWSGGGVGNVSDPPRFIDPDGPDDDPNSYADNDYRLLHDSPCIDAGDNLILPVGLSQDLDMMRRFVDRPATPDAGVGAPPVVDMGAFEYQCSGDLDGDGDVDTHDLAHLLSNYHMPEPLNYADGDMDFDGDVDLSDLAALLSVYGLICS